MGGNKRILVVTGIGGWVDGTPQVGKIETHIYPLADAAERVDVVSPGPTTDRDDITFHQIPRSSWQFLTLLRQFLVAARLAASREYDLVASYCLVPYGVFALVCGWISRTPSHLGIIGKDLDVHAVRWYGPVIRWLFRRFDAISVAGTVYRRRLEEFGVDPEHVFILYHPVSERYLAASQAENPEYDLLWLTRLSPEKDPLLFVEILRILRDRSVSFTAAIVGNGPLESDVRDAVERYGLSDRVDVPGWTDDPLRYYRNSSIYVMTSSREMLPLSLVEAMYVGVPPVVPSLGAIPDTVNDGESGFVVEDGTAESFADEIERLLRDDALRSTMGSNAPDVHRRMSRQAVAGTWKGLLDQLGRSEGTPSTSSGEAIGELDS